MLSDVVEWKDGQPVVGHDDDRELPVVYVVVLGQFGPFGDLSGVSVSTDDVFFTHMSSDRYWLLADTTIGFGGERRDRFYQAFPNGFRRVLVDRGEDLPAAIAHHFEKKGDTK